MLLQNKNAVIYGGAGSIGATVARAFASAGARVHLAGRTRATLDEVAASIRSGGGFAETAQVDALDERAVDEYGVADGFLAEMRDRTMLKRLPSMTDVGNVAVFVASDQANAVTAATVNITCGAIVD